MGPTYKTGIVTVITGMVKPGPTYKAGTGDTVGAAYKNDNGDTLGPN